MRREKGTQKLLETVMTQNLPQSNVRHQTTDPGSLEKKRTNEQIKPRNSQVKTMLQDTELTYKKSMSFLYAIHEQVQF